MKKIASLLIGIVALGLALLQASPDESLSVSDALFTDNQLQKALARGHAEERHVGKDQKYLINRMNSQSTIPAASSFDDLADAKKAVKKVLLSDSGFQKWMNSDCNTKKAFKGRGSVKGYGLTRSEFNQLQKLKNTSDYDDVLKKALKKDMSRITVVVAGGNKNKCADTFKIITAYPGK